jgi:hypothetical protein
LLLLIGVVWWWHDHVHILEILMQETKTHSRVDIQQLSDREWRPVLYSRGELDGQMVPVEEGAICKTEDEAIYRGSQIAIRWLMKDYPALQQEFADKLGQSD